MRTELFNRESVFVPGVKWLLQPVDIYKVNAANKNMIIKRRGRY